MYPAVSKKNFLSRNFDNTGEGDNFTLQLQAPRDKIGPCSLSIAAGAVKYFVMDMKVD